MSPPDHISEKFLKTPLTSHNSKYKIFVLSFSAYSCPGQWGKSQLFLFPFPVQTGGVCPSFWKPRRQLTSCVVTAWPRPWNQCFQIIFSKRRQIFIQMRHNSASIEKRCAIFSSKCAIYLWVLLHFYYQNFEIFVILNKKVVKKLWTTSCYSFFHRILAKKVFDQRPSMTF